MEKDTPNLYPVHCQPADWARVQAALKEFKNKFYDGGGENLRLEMVTTLTGGRLTVVFDWEDM